MATTPQLETPQRSLRKNNAEARLLLRLMHDLSEDRWCAQWMAGCEYALWAELTGKPVNNQKPWGLSEDDREELRTLQELADGWFLWSDEEKDIVFLTTDEWLTHLSALKS